MNRDVPLVTYMALQRRVPLERRTPMRAESPHTQTRRARTDTGPDKAMRELVLERDSGCVICGRGPHGLQIHHRKPRRMGGRSIPEINSPVNLVSLCPADHAVVESARTDALEAGWLVYEFEDPAEVPLPHHLFGACYLLPDGGVCLVPHVGGGAA
jgi:5-methylcytosine-specific restriction protein A